MMTRRLIKILIIVYIFSFFVFFSGLVHKQGVFRKLYILILV